MMDVNLRRLRYFLAVAEHGNFGRAAESVFLSASALSEQIRKLESELDVRLFDRNPRGAQLTHIGAEMAAQARLVLMQSGRFVHVLDQYRKKHANTLRLGFVTFAAGEVTARLVNALRATDDAMQIEFIHLTYSRQVDAVLDGEVDASIARGPIDEAPGLRSTILASEPRMVMVSDKHRLAGLHSVTRADLQHERRVTTDGVPEAWRKWWSLDPNPDGSTPPYGPLVHSFDEQIEVAASSIAISIVPATAASIYRRTDVSFIPIVDAPPSSIMICSREDHRSEMLDRLNIF
jgi:DNA-binding transcriptional LysR family regulator